MTVDRSRLPVPGADAPVHVSRRSRSPRSPNGLRRLDACATPSVPVVTLALLVRRGAADDPPGKEGLAAITVDMLDEGSGDRSAIEMHEALARLGAQLDTDIGADAALLGVTALSRFAGPRARRCWPTSSPGPSLRDDDFARVRQLRLHRLTQLRDMPGAVADRAFVAAAVRRASVRAHAARHRAVARRADASTTCARFTRRRCGPSDATLDRGRRLRARRPSQRWPREAFGGWDGRGGPAA